MSPEVEQLVVLWVGQRGAAPVDAADICAVRDQLVARAAEGEHLQSLAGAVVAAAWGRTTALPASTTATAASSSTVADRVVVPFRRPVRRERLTSASAS